MDLTIVPLGRQHNRKTFDCGEPSLNQYPHLYANQDIKKRVSRIYVATPSDKQEQVVGYYSLSADSLHTVDLRHIIRRRLPKYPVPVAMLDDLPFPKPTNDRALDRSCLQMPCSAPPRPARSWRFTPWLSMP